MARRLKTDKTIFFPWERGAPFLRGLGLARARPILAAAALAAVMIVLGSRERERVAVRSTQATIGVIARSVDAFRADHDKNCPDSLTDLKALGYTKVEPKDAWGHPLRLLCPGFSHRDSYDLISDGPDGVFGGLDRVE
jgi:general secretion pathway protein G